MTPSPSTGPTPLMDDAPDSHPQSPPEDRSSGAIVCVDQLVPEDAVLHAFSEDGDARVVHGDDGRRAFVLAHPDQEIVLLGVPRGDLPSADALRSWYADRPACRPVRFRVTSSGQARRMAGNLVLPESARTHPDVAPVLRRLLPEEDTPDRDVGGEGGAPTASRPPSDEATATEAPDTLPEGQDPSAPDDGPVPEESTSSPLADDAESIVAGPPSLQLECRDGVRWAVFSVTGPPPRVRERGEALEIYGADDASFVVLGWPERVDNMKEGALAGWYEEYPDCRSLGYRVDDKELGIDLATLSTFEDLAAADTGTLEIIHGRADAPWMRLLDASERSRRRRRLRRAVGARSLDRHLRRHGTPPPFLRGRTGDLYVPLGVSVVDPDDLVVRGEVSGDTDPRILAVEATDRETGEITTHLFAPSGGIYVVGGPETTRDDIEAGEARALEIRAGGDRAALSSTRRLQAWARGEHLPVQLARRQRGAEAPRIARNDGDRMAGTPDAPQPEAPSTRDSPDAPDATPTFEPPPPSDGDMDAAWMAEMEERAAWEAEQAPPEGGLDRAPPEVGENPTSTSDRAKDSSPSVSEDDDLRWHSPHEGYTNTDNWRARSPRGELWVSELLDVVADSEEQDALGCLVPVQLLRKGYQITESDKERIDRALEQLAGRVDSVRVFELDGQSYFARPADEGLRIIGPRGTHVEDENLRAAVREHWPVDGEGLTPEAPAGDRNASEARGRGGR